MKENKFRAWDSKQSKMIYNGDLYNPYETNEHLLKQKVYPCKVINIGVLYTNKLSEEKSNDYIELVKENHHKTYYSDWENDNINLDSIKLMQYTGLKDKNGREIYEGDIIESRHFCKFIVSYKNGAFVRSTENSNIYLLYDASIVDDCLEDYKIVGNIYENPGMISR